jgi:hypothetical protein
MLSYLTDLMKLYLENEIKKDTTWDNFKKPDAYKNVNSSGYLR